MDPQMVVLRTLHIVFGTFWVGTDLFATFLLIPRLRALGRDVERPVMAALIRVLPPALMVGSVITVVTGVWITGIMRGWNLAWIGASGWGTAILVGALATVAALVVGFGILPPLTISMDRLDRGIEGRKPTPEEDRRLQQLAGQVTALARANSLLLIVVVISMAVARFI